VVAPARTLRIKGELLLLQSEPGAAAATEDHFRQALDAGQSTRCVVLGTPRCDEPSPAAAKSGPIRRRITCLQPIYDRFTEGFDTADLKSAKALLDALGQPGPETTPGCCRTDSG